MNYYVYENCTASPTIPITEMFDHLLCHGYEKRLFLADLISSLCLLSKKAYFSNLTLIINFNQFFLFVSTKKILYEWRYDKPLSMYSKLVEIAI